MNMCCNCPKCNPGNPQGPHIRRWRVKKTIIATLGGGLYTESIVVNDPVIMERYKAKGYEVKELDPEEIA